MGFAWGSGCGGGTWWGVLAALQRPRPRTQTPRGGAGAGPGCGSPQQPSCLRLLLQPPSFGASLTRVAELECSQLQTWRGFSLSGLLLRPVFILGVLRSLGCF